MVKLFSDFLIPDPESAWKNAGKAQSNPIKDSRAKVVKSIDGALASLETGEKEPKRGLYKIKADLAQVTIRAGRSIVPIEGNDRNVVPATMIKGFFEAVKTAVEAGKLDDLLTGNATITAKPAASKRSESWTPERKAAHAAKLKESWAKRKTETK